MATAQILARGESAYKCDTCGRSTRVPSNKVGFEIVQRCIITQGCHGKLHKLTVVKEINDTPAFPPSVDGVRDWFPRKLLYTYQQGYKSLVWTIKHDLGCNPSVHVFVDQPDGENIGIQANVTPSNIAIIDLNTVQLTFDTPQLGVAQCVSLTSPGHNTVGNFVPPVAVPFQLTHKGELTIATLATFPLLDLTITYNNPIIGATPVQYVGIDDIPSTGSAWVSKNRIFLGGKVYVVRSFNLVTHQLAPTAFREGKIVNGSTFSFAANQSAPGQTLILLSQSPFTPLDIVSDKYVDLASINTTTPETYYYKGEAFVATSVIKSLYPGIVVVD